MPGSLLKEEESIISIAHVIGVDPGLVHTGVVGLLFGTKARRVTISHVVIDGPDAAAVAIWVQSKAALRSKVFVEAYRPRQNLNADQRMTQVEHELRRELPSAKFLPNMGIKRVITQEMMDLLEVWTFPSTTHHQDLRSAARIALLGMVKDPDMNVILADVVHAHIDGRPWTISHE